MTSPESLADEMLALADAVDGAEIAALAGGETWPALLHVLESLEAARRDARRRGLVVEVLDEVSASP